MNKLPKCFNYFFIYLFLPAIIFLVMSYGIKDIMNIHIATDEFGYWTAAANILGYDWSQSASLNEYYSYGYGMILAFLMLFDDPNISYKVALFLNIVFVIISYFELMKIVKNMFTITNIKCALISFSVNLYSGLLFYTKLTLVECLLWLCFCTSVLLMQEYILYEKKIYLVLASLTNIYMLWVHMRTIGIMVALLFSIIFYTIVLKKEYKKIFLVVIIFGIGLVLLLYMKNDLKISQYSGNILSSNDFSGQWNKLKMLFSLEGIKKFALNIVGRIWYLGNSTFLIFYFGLYSCIRELIRTIRERNKFLLFYAYILLSVLFAIGISAIFMLEIQNGRRDTLFYGRYSENVIAPILVLGMIEIFEYKYSFNKIILFIFSHLMGAIIVQKTIIAYKMQSCLDFSIPGFYYWIKKEEFSNNTYLSATLFVIFIAVIYIAVMLRLKDIGRIIFFLVFCVLSVYVGYKSYEVSDTHDHDEDYYEVYLSIMDSLNDDTNEIFYCYEDADMENYYSFMGVDRLQFLMKDKVINLCNLKTDKLICGSTIVTRPASDTNNYLKEVCKLILVNKEFNVYEY